MTPLEWPTQTRPLQGGWVLSCEHSASSYGIPVLVAPTGEAFGPGDLLSVSDVAEMRGLSMQTLHPNITRSATERARGWRRVGRKGGWAIFAADAVKP